MAVLETDPETAMTSNYLVGYDGSESAQRAFELALKLARADGGRVRAVTALRTTEAGPESCAMMMTDASSQRARAMLDVLKDGAGDLTGRVETELVYGSPGDVLMAQVEQHGIDHVVIGHTGHGSLARWLLGSASNDIVSRSRIPVTIVR
jgi:nucleotide-binding universal stress UspA family protein